MLTILTLEILHGRISHRNKNNSKNKIEFHAESVKKKSIEEISKEKSERMENFITLLPLLVTLLGIIIMSILNKIFG